MKREKKEMVNPEENGKFHKTIEHCIERDHGNVSVRIDKNTIVSVKPAKMNADYATEYKTRVENYNQFSKQNDR